MSSAAELSADQLRQLYYLLQLNRQLEVRLERLFRQGKIVGGLYSSLGQEAVSVGSASALEAQDWIAPMIRNIGALLVKGVPPRDIFTQHMARATSPTRGKDGTSHFADLKGRHIVAPSSMLGDLIPVMTGVAMAGRYLGQKIVAMTWIGDGGSSTGAFHEGMNLAAQQRAPLVVILENNQWAYSTPASRQAPLRDFAERAAAYGIRSSIADGNDVLAVHRASAEAVAECRAGRGPWLIEMKTMRMKGHAQHDAADYVPKEMIEYWKARDPLARFEKTLSERGAMSAEQKAEIDARVERELDAEQQLAEESPFPAAEEAAQGVYCEGCHEIAAEWMRPKEQVMPPATEKHAAWRITDFGAFIEPRAAAGAPVRPVQARPAQQPDAKADAKADAKPANESPQDRQQRRDAKQNSVQHGPQGAPKKAPATKRAPRPNSQQRISPGQEPLTENPAQAARAVAAANPPAPVDAEQDEATPAPAETPLRVPFGRGPKDRAFAKEQPPQNARPAQNARPPQNARTQHGPHGQNREQRHGDARHAKHGRPPGGKGKR
jgi:TPP-dependent pyruvate/acetoin dehydrogenase alpha subunit